MQRPRWNGQHRAHAGGCAGRERQRRLAHSKPFEELQQLVRRAPSFVLVNGVAGGRHDHKLKLALRGTTVYNFDA